MIETALLALGLVLIVEGLVYALAPSLIEQMLVALSAMPPEAAGGGAGTGARADPCLGGQDAWRLILPNQRGHMGVI